MPSPEVGFEKITRILIVEDDVTMEPLWRYVIETARPGTLVEWMTSGEAAASRLQSTAFDLIISDIFLGGEVTGLDLWELADNDRFLLISVITPARLDALALNTRRPLPSYIQKPLDPTQLIETVRALLGANNFEANN
jgi:DNA-binding NtrC family response regulator